MQYGSNFFCLVHSCKQCKTVYYEGLENAELFELITKTEPYPCMKASYEAKKLISALLEKDPAQRLGVLAGKERDILKHAVRSFLIC